MYLLCPDRVSHREPFGGYAYGAPAPECRLLLFFELGADCLLVEVQVETLPSQPQRDIEDED